MRGLEFQGLRLSISREWHEHFASAILSTIRLSKAVTTLITNNNSYYKVLI